MNAKEIEELLKSAIEKWGHRAQIEMLQEEATELALAARKLIREFSKGRIKNLSSEIADVEILILQMKIMYPDIIKMIQEEKEFKLTRLKDRINKNDFNLKTKQ